MERKQSLVDRLLRRLGSGRHDEADPGPGDRLRLSGRNLRVPNRGQAFAVEMGKQTLHVCPDAPPAGVVDPARQDFVVFDPDLYYEGIAHALRLAPGKVLAIDHREAHQELALGHPRDAFRRHLQISHNGETLDFRDPISELGTYLSLVDGNGEDTPFLARRRDRIRPG